jgi:hypothetical protein
MISPWAEEEVAAVDLGDQRLDARAARLLSALGDRPNLSIPAACGGHAETQAAYRFFDNEKVTFEKVLAPHAERTLQRMTGQAVVLLVHDTTEVDLTRPEQAVAGAGKLDAARRGVLLHVLHAFTPDGTPLGTVGAEVLNRADGAVPYAKRRPQAERGKPIEEKESLRWLSGLRQSRALAARLPQVQCVCVADSEADIYEWFAEPRAVGCDGGGGGGAATAAAAAVEWLVRACHNRVLKHDAADGGGGGGGGHDHLRDAVLATPVLYKVDLLIRARQTKTAAESRRRRLARDARRAADVEVRAATLTLRPPWRAGCKLPPVTVNVVLVREPRPPAGEPALEWILVTTLPIDTLPHVRGVVDYYCVRWGIEILFRTLKSGCRIEWRRFEHVDRVLPCVALYLIVAWRTLFVCRMGRECPDADCETLFEPAEWKGAWVAVHQEKPPKRKPRLAEMVHLIACLGGYVERPSSEPGPQTIWIGLQRMYDLAWAWQTFGPGAKIRRA